MRNYVDLASQPGPWIVPLIQATASIPLAHTLAHLVHTLDRGSNLLLKFVKDPLAHFLALGLGLFLLSQLHL